MKRGLLIVLILAAGIALEAGAILFFGSSLPGRIDATIPWVICAQERDRDRAIAACTLVIDRGDREALIDRVSAFYNRGVAFQAKGETDRALRDYDQAIALDPENGAAYGNRGAIHADRGEDQRAIADFDQAIRIDPSDAFATRNRGVTHVRLHDEAAALRDFDKAIALMPGLADTYCDRGRLFERRGDRERAAADRERCRRPRP